MSTIGIIGFIGVGEIARAMVEGLASAEGTEHSQRIVLSPRSRANSTALAERFSTVSVAADNGAVAEAADTVVLAVRPEQIAQALDGVSFRDSQVVISALAGVTLAELRTLVGAHVPIIRSIPLPPVSTRSSVTVVSPAHPVATELFDTLGGTLSVPDESTLAVFSGITGSFTGFLQYVAVICDWAADLGVPRADAEAFVRTAFAELGPALRDTDRTMTELVRDHETAGGLNEQLRLEVFGETGTAALRNALDGLHSRVTGG